MKLPAFFKREPVLCVSALAAAVSCAFVPPDGAYIGYIDFRTIVLLYCLMAAVSGFRKAGVFAAMAHALCAKAPDTRRLSLVLVLLCFFSSMLITNDVALLTFVPFALTVLGLSADKKTLALVVTLQTVAANLGSMLTPLGNPQNLHLYSHYDMGMGEFFAATAPVCLLSLVLISILCLCLKNSTVSLSFGQRPKVDKRSLCVSLAAFALCLPVVFRLMEWYVLLPAFVLLLLVFDRKLLAKADFFLLMTFVCFFVFVGNIGRIESVRSALQALTSGREMLAGALASQVISNVPAAVLLSGFTDAGRQLLLGVNIGGLGTPIASLASLIAMKQYSMAEEADSGYFMKAFLVINFALLALLLAFAAIFM